MCGCFFLPEDRYHSLGSPPYNKYGTVPALSHYFHDIVPYYLCCHWSNLCESYLYLRETKDARGYKEPRMGSQYHLLLKDQKRELKSNQCVFVCVCVCISRGLWRSSLDHVR